MIKNFSKKHPWLCRQIKKNYWSFLLYGLRKESYVYHSINYDIQIKLIKRDDSVSKFIFLDSYEAETVAFLEKLALPEDIIYDIGANIGYYSLILSKLVGPNGRIHSFEPSNREFLTLAENVSINRLTNVYLNQLAVSDRSGVIKMSILESSAYGAYNSIGTIKHHKVAKQKSRTELVRTVTLDEYISIYNTERPSIIKIDVEGAEANVLRGGSNVFSDESSPIIVMEICEETLNGLNTTSSDVLEMLKGYSFSLFSISPDGFLVPFQEGVSLNLVAGKGRSLQRLERAISARR